MSPKDWIKSFLTVSDGAVDTATVIGLAIILNYLGMSWYSLLNKPDHNFDMMGFGGGAAAILAAFVGHRYLSKDDGPCSH